MREAQWFFLNISLPSHTVQCHIHLWHFWQLIILLRNLHWWDALYSLFLLSQASLQQNLPYIEAALAGCLAPKGPSTKSCANSYPAAAAAKSLQSCPTLCDPIDGTPPGSPVPGILQARTLEWVVISFSNAWKWKVKVKSLSRVCLLATPWTAAYQAPPSMGFSRQEYWSGVPLPSPNSYPTKLKDNRVPINSLY